MAGRDAPRNLGAADDDIDEDETSAHDLSAYGIGARVDEPSTTVGPLPVARPKSEERSQAGPPRAREASRRVIPVADREGISEAPADSTRAEVNPLLSPKPAVKARPKHSPGTEETELPEGALEEALRGSGLDTGPSLPVPDEPNTSVTFLPQAREAAKSDPGSSAPPNVAAGPRSGSSAPPVRSSTRGEVSLSAIARSSSAPGALPRAADPGRSGASGNPAPAPRKGTHSEMPIVSGAPPSSLLGGRNQPASPNPPRRAGTRSETPIVRDPIVAPVAPPVPERRAAIPEPRPGSALLGASAEPKSKREIATRIEDEETGPANEIPKLSPLKGGAAAAAKPVAEKAPAPKTPPKAPMVKPAELPAQGGGRAEGRVMLADQSTGQFRPVEMLATEKPKPKDLKPAKETKPKEAKPTAKADGAGQKAVDGLRKLAHATGLHKLADNGSVRDLMNRTGMLKLSGQIQSLTGLHRLGAQRFGFQAVIAGLMLLGGVGLVVHLVFGNDLPPQETLQFLYPYGFTGGVQPNGRSAPPVSAVTFKFTGTVDCGSNVCDHYDVNGQDGSFHIEMTVTKHDDGTWVLAGGPPPPR